VIGCFVSFAVRKWKVKLYSQPRSVINHLDTSAVKVGDSGNEAETEPVAGAVPAALQSIEPFEYVFALLDRNSRTTIGDGEDASIGAVRDNDFDLPSIAPVLDRVIDEIRDGVEQEIAITDYAHPLRAGKPEPNGLLLSRRIEQLYDLAGDLAQVDIVKRGGAVVHLDLRDPQQ